MTKHIFSAVMLIFWATAPLLVNAFAYLPEQAPLVIPKQLSAKPDPSTTLFYPQSGMQGLPSYGMPNTTGAKPVATVKRSSKWKQLVSLRKQMKKMKRNMPDMAGYENSALIWGAAGLFAAISFVLLGILLESLIIFGALLAIPFGIIALINHRKARESGSKRVAGAVMAITGMAIVASVFLAFVILVLAYS